MSAVINACFCGYSGALAGTNNGVCLTLNCPECRREIKAFTMAGLVEAWNKRGDENEQATESADSAPVP